MAAAPVGAWPKPCKRACSLAMLYRKPAVIAIRVPAGVGTLGRLCGRSGSQGGLDLLLIILGFASPVAGPARLLAGPLAHPALLAIGGFRAPAATIGAVLFTAATASAAFLVHKSHYQPSFRAMPYKDFR